MLYLKIFPMLRMWKIDTWKEMVLHCDVNILIEINKDMSRVKESDRLEAITKGWWKGSMCRTEYLVEEDNAFREQRQQGGVAILANGSIITHIIAQGGDERKLGRWRWFTIRGKNQRKTCIIGCYRPGPAWVATSNQAVALHKKRALGDCVQDPYHLWIEDLKTLIRARQNEGCEIILTGDFNEDLQDEVNAIILMTEELGLREALLEKYKVPNSFSTHARGSTVIDGVFISQGLMIEAGGYTCIDESPSDHRWLWFDITTDNLVGGILSERARPLERKATSKVPSIKEQFNFLLNEQILLHNMVNKTKQLVATVKLQMEDKGSIDKRLGSQIDKLEEVLVRLVKTADNKCQKGRRGSIPASPIIWKARGAIRILRLVMRRWNEKGKKHRPKMTRIQRLVKKYKYGGCISFNSWEAIQDASKKAYAHYRVIRPHAILYRETYLGQLAEEKSLRDGLDIDKHFRLLMEQEETKRQYQRIKLAEGRLGRNGVVRIEKDVDGLRVVISDKKAIEDEIMKANKQKLLQAGNTPLRTPPLQQLVGEQMDFDKWENILRGYISLPLEDVEEGTRLWYNFISSQSIDEFVLDWTPEEYFESWKKMPEDKSSAPGIHAGHLKCVDPSSAAAYVISSLALLPLKSGYAPDLWRRGIDSMIPKKTDDLRPEKLRLILLMDARFNHNNKLIGKKMLEYGETKNKLAEEQYGSRKNKSSSQHATNKRLILDHIRQYRKKTVYCANDARSCYDRILFIVSYLTLRIFGVPKEAARCSVDTICKMRHHIRTIFGDSSDYYGGETWRENGGYYPHGNGQGNGNGPSLWSCISSPMLNILREEGFGIDFDSPISHDKVQLSAIGFVDDMDYIQTESQLMGKNM